MSAVDAIDPNQQRRAFTLRGPSGSEDDHFRLIAVWRRRAHELRPDVASTPPLTGR
jgi:hypothetical protein